MRLLVLGRRGQLGWELERLLPAFGEVIAFDRSQCDLADAALLAAKVRAARPEVIVNAAAYTAVERAESEPQLAYAVNAAAPAVLADEARQLGAFLVHYSTDYVFDGAKKTPYVEADTPHPLQVYGKSKLAGEAAIRACGCRHAILRTSWVYAARGRNFLLAMLDKARRRERLRVVADQRGTPTWACDIAQLTAAMLRLSYLPEGTFHAAAAGETTWCEFAREILRLADIAAPVEAVASADYAGAAKRPANSVLDSTLLPRVAGVPAIGHWRERLAIAMR